MEILGWIAWALGWALSLLWSLVWLLLGGWVSTIAQVLAVLAGIAVWRYGWRRAPAEMTRQIAQFVRFVRGWLATPTEGVATRAAVPADRRPAAIRFKEPGDVNLSTLMTLAMVVGLWAVGVAG